MTWETAKLGDVCEVVSGATPKTSVEEFWNGEIRWATPKDLSDLKGEVEINETARRISAAGLASCGARVLPVGSVLLSSRAPIGHVAINTVPMATNQGFKSLVPDDSVVARFLYWWLVANRSRLEAMGRGATFKEVSKAVVESIVIPLPSLDEQHHIVRVLDAHLRLIQTAQREERVLKSMEKAIVDSAPFDRRMPLQDLCASPEDIKCGPFGTQLAASEFSSSGVALWGIKHTNAAFTLPADEFISTETAARLHRYSIQRGDLVMTRKGTVGNCALYDLDEPGVMHSDLLRVRLDSTKAPPRYIAALLHHSVAIRRRIDRMSPGAVMKGINVSKLKTLDIDLPSTDRQRHAAQALDLIDELAQRIRTRAALLGELFASLQHRAFRGEL